MGTGELREEMEEKVQQLGLTSQVHFLGVRTDVPQLLDAMDVYLFPSFMEGLSVAMLEAQCAGLPCVVSDTIPREVEMTDLISFVSLKESPKVWAEIILKRAKKINNREPYPEVIAQAGYDIHRNAEWLQNYYLEQWQKH